MALYDPASVLGIDPILLVVIAIWSIIWKGFALWKSARRGENIWFVALLIVNTIGILEILYLFVFSKSGKGKKKSKKK